MKCNVDHAILGAFKCPVQSCLGIASGRYRQSSKWPKAQSLASLFAALHMSCNISAFRCIPARHLVELFVTAVKVQTVQKCGTGLVTTLSHTYNAGGTLLYRNMVTPNTHATGQIRIAPTLRGRTCDPGPREGAMQPPSRSKRSRFMRPPMSRPASNPLCASATLASRASIPGRKASTSRLLPPRLLACAEVGLRPARHMNSPSPACPCCRLSVRMPC